jgi:hypothetical protein
MTHPRARARTSWGLIHDGVLSMRAGSTPYSPEVAAEICARISQGESLRSVCKDAHMPHKATVCRWLGANEGFRARYALAHDLQAEFIAEDIQEIADDASKDWMRIERDGEVHWVLDPENIQRARLRIDTRKWMLAKLPPKKYGDRIRKEYVSRTPARLRRPELVIVDT